jgi:hypothetical protein
LVSSGFKEAFRKTCVGNGSRFFENERPKMALEIEVTPFLPMRLQPRRRVIKHRHLPAVAKSELKYDRRGLAADDPSPASVVSASLEWLAVAQDRSKSADRGVARDYSLVTGWATSYPETTGYIAPTLIEYGHRTGDHSPMNRTAAWLRASRDADGCWRRHPNPSTKRCAKAYETHVSWGLYEVERMEPGRGGVKRSFPVDGSNDTYEYLNWSAKFLADANTMEMDLESA